MGSLALFTLLIDYMANAEGLATIPPKRRAPLLAALAIAGLFFAFAGDGIRAYFTPDDMMNLYVSWSAPAGRLLHNDRPMGAIVYRAMFALFGLNPLPYRVLCFGLLAANLVLLYRLCRRLSGSREVAALACLLGAYHAHLADLYYSTGTIYDLLCALFFLLAFVFYLEGRATVWVVALYVCALASKEMAVLLPAYVLLYEWIWHRNWKSRFVWIAIPITGLYLVWKLTGPMVANPSYAPHFSLHAFLTAWKAYAGDLFYGAIAFSTVKLVLLWAAVAACAAIVRRREAWLAWWIVMLGVLPFIFIEPRGFFVMYLVMPGWYLLAASALVRARDAFPRWADALAVTPGQLALFAAVVLTLIPLHRAEKPLGDSWVAGAHQQVRTILGTLEARNPTMPRGGKVLFLSDPYDVDDWILTSTFRLAYHDRNLHVDRVKADASLADRQGEYDHVFRLGEKGLEMVK